MPDSEEVDMFVVTAITGKVGDAVAKENSMSEQGPCLSRRDLIRGSAFAAAGAASVTYSHGAEAAPSDEDRFEALTRINVEINGVAHELELEPRVSLLDMLRERLQLTGTKKGCNRGECGACTVHMDGRRVNACLVLAAAADGRIITTIEELAGESGLHPVQQAFINHDAFQCGFCTCGQIMSAVGCIAEGHTGSNEEIREWMSGNICRCSAYPQIAVAVAAAAKETL
jgi:xanthine dehydrogenase YagT iron-sulfur-binding subunit